MEILLEKATLTGHEWHTKIGQVILHGNSFGKGYVHWTRIALHFKTSYFTLKILLKRLRSLDTNCTSLQNKFIYVENPFEKATFTGHELRN